MRSAFILLAALGLAACDTEAGADMNGNYGQFERDNVAAMTGERNAAIGLTRKFAAEAPNTVHFAFNSAVLDATARAALNRQAAWIRRYPEARFRVFGHTDLVGTAAYNKALGLRRAQAVVAYLSARGVSRARLEAVVSYGKTQPLVYVPGPNEQNRRTVTEVSGFLRGSTSLLNGKYAAQIFDGYVASASPQAQNTVTNQTQATSAQ